MNNKQDITSVIYNIVFSRKNSKDIPLINIKSKSGIEKGSQQFKYFNK